MGYFKRITSLFLLMILFASCSTDAEIIAVMDNSEISEPGAEVTLSKRELEFINEYEYVTFNLAPDSFGASVNEKWSTDVKIFLDGELPENYESEVNGSLSEFNTLLSAGLSFGLANTLEESNIHLIFGEKDAIRAIWPDMFEAIGDVDFQGYALYDRDEDFNITSARIWLRTNSIPLFKHELGHTIGLGHASEDFCAQDFSRNQSFMCSFLKEDLSVFDEAILKTLYNPNVEVGLTFPQLKPIIENLLLTDVIRVE